jgi:hypothetical protein
MEQNMPLSEKYQSEPSLTPMYKRHWWILNRDWRCKDFIVPKGFTTDLDSVPHIPGVFALYKGRSRTSALAHDYQYALGERSRKDIDELFLFLMIDDNVPKFVAYSMFYAVRLFGWRYYKRSRGNTAGERLKSRLIDHDGNV